MEDGVERVRLSLDSGAMYVEARQLGEDGGRERDIAATKPDLNEILKVVKEFSVKVVDTIKDSGAARASVEFGCEIGVETGQLVAVLGKASGKSSLKITLEWDSSAR